MIAFDESRRRVSVRRAFACGLLFCCCLPALAATSLRTACDSEFEELAGQLSRFQKANPERRARLQAEALDPAALIQPSDRDPSDIALRRAHSLLDHYRTRSHIPGAALAEWEEQWKNLAAKAKVAAAGQPRRDLFLQVCELRRELVFANPLLNFDRVVCLLEQPGEQRIVEQARAIWPGHSRGGGPLIIEKIKSEPRLSAPLAGIKVTSGPWRGKELTGKFSGLELNDAGTELLFAATTDAEVWHIFRFNLVTHALEQLTDGPADDMDPCPLPSGRIVFTSTRRGGIGRCLLTPQSLTYTLYSMEPDGSDIVCLSFHETNEWQPSVNHEGKIIYTRWDYVDRHWGTAHHFWECFPDGRDPRNYHGNYPAPWSAMTPDLQTRDYGKKGFVSGRFLRPDVEIAFRAIPNAATYTATAVGHHEGFSGSLVLLDPRIPDDGKMAQLKRITPEYPFPEVEDGGAHAYGTVWPLSEDFYLCNFNCGLYVLDRFGNREVIYDPGTGPYKVRDPFPLRSRPAPPALPVLTWQGKREGLPDHKRATISVMNVYANDEAGRLPAGVKVKWMRLVQVIPQMLIDRCCSMETITQTSFATDAIGRIPLGVVPVEEDGSVYCEAPVGKALYFQLLDENGMAVQSMRSATYVHPGEHLSCVGCHEDKWQTTRQDHLPIALNRAPSKILPEVASGALPFNFVQLVKAPVFDQKCVPCHREHPKAPDMSYKSLARNDRAFSYPGEGGLELLGIGGSRSTPGRVGAQASGIYQALTQSPQHKDVRLSKDEWRRLTLWLDLNCNELGWIGNDPAELQAQREGIALWPPIDVDQSNPLGVELRRP